MEHTLHGDQERIEDGADTDGGQQHGHEVLSGRLDGGIKRLETFTQILQITINYHNRIIYNHSQHHNKRRQGYNVQFDAHHIHDCHTHKGTQGNGDGRHDSRTQREQYHHHQDDDSHRYQQIAQEIAHTHRYHFGLIGNAGNLYVLGQFVQTELLQYFIHLLAILHHIVTRRHLHREQHARVSVLLDTTRHGFVLAHHTGHIANTCHLTCHRVGEDNLVGNLLLGVFLSLNVDGYLLVVVADSATHGGDALCL